MTMRFRIASIFIAAALVLSCGVLAAGHVSLYAQREAVTLEETTLLGGALVSLFPDPAL